MDKTPEWVSFTFVYVVPAVSAAAAIFAALFAGFALKYIGEQIRIANVQTALAIRDYDATVEALGITKEQAKLADAERARKPDLLLIIDGESKLLRVPQGLHDFRLHVHNQGNKVSNGAVIRILWPADGMVDRLDTLDPVDRMSVSFGTSKDGSRFSLRNKTDVEGTSVYFFSKQLEKDIIPLSNVFVGHLDVDIAQGRYLVGYSVIADDGTKFPADKPHEYIEVRVG